MNTWEYKKHRFGKFLFPIFFIGVIFLVAAIVMYLWNAIVPGVLPAKPISYWQAMGLFILSRLLFGGFRFGRRGHRSLHAEKPEWRDKWMNMSEEEKQKLKETWKERCGKKGGESY